MLFYHLSNFIKILKPVVKLDGNLPLDLVTFTTIVDYIEYYSSSNDGILSITRGVAMSFQGTLAWQTYILRPEIKNSLVPPFSHVIIIGGQPPGDFTLDFDHWF